MEGLSVLSFNTQVTQQPGWGLYSNCMQIMQIYIERHSTRRATACSRGRF